MVFTTLGSKTKTTFLHTEAHKTTQEFTVGATAVKSGMPIKLDTDGKISPWVKTDGLHLLVGYCYNDAAVGALVTVWTRGYMIIFALSNAAINAGIASYESFDAASEVEGTVGYSKYSQGTTAANTNGWALDSATGANELIRVLLLD